MLSFRKRGPAAEKLLSPSRVRVLCTAHVKESPDRNGRRSISVELTVVTEVPSKRPRHDAL